MTVIDQMPLGAFLARLASRSPTPGGGAVAALHAAQAAALIEMVARYSDRSPDSATRARAAEIAGAAESARTQALALVQADSDAFAAVAEAYRMPRATGAEAESRSLAIARASLAAARPAADVMVTAGRLIGLAEDLYPIANPSVIADVSAAVDAARAALGTSRLNVEINLKPQEPSDPEVSELRALCSEVGSLQARADALARVVHDGV